MNERTKELALESGLAYRRSDGRCWIDAGFVDADLELFAELVRQDERELCVEDVRRANFTRFASQSYVEQCALNREEAVAAIRARSKHD